MTSERQEILHEAKMTTGRLSMHQEPPSWNRLPATLAHWSIPGKVSNQSYDSISPPGVHEAGDDPCPLTGLGTRGDEVAVNAR